MKLSGGSSGSNYKIHPLLLVIIFIFLTISAFAISRGGIIVTFIIILIPPIIYSFIKIFKNPIFGLVGLIVLSFVVNGASRYIGEAPIGLGIDALLLLTFLSVLIQNKEYYQRWKLIKPDILLATGIWFLYDVLELFNPLTSSKVAWFYAVRASSIYLLMTIPLVFIILNRLKYLNFFLYLWGIFTILATLKGMQQLYIGLDPWEQRWLNEGGYITHIIFGRLRIFSFFSDAGQFGAAQAQAGVMGLIIASGSKRMKDKIFYFLVGFFGLYGMIISGTRGAIAVPFAAGLVYILLRKSVRMFIVGLLLLIGTYCFLNFTYIGNSVYFIYRLRTAFDPNDPSLQVRLENQRILKNYLADKPMGGGIGSAGYWGERFSPGNLLARTPTDSWYVQIWAEQGIIGLALYLILLFYILGKGSLIILFKVKDPELLVKMIALAAGTFGIMVAAYGNGIIGQLPTGILTYMSLACINNGEVYEKEINELKPLTEV